MSHIYYRWRQILGFVLLSFFEKADSYGYMFVLLRGVMVYLINYRVLPPTEIYVKGILISNLHY